MSHQDWIRHRDEIGMMAMPIDARAAHIVACTDCKARRKTRAASRKARERNDAMRSLGMTKTPYGWE